MCKRTYDALTIRDRMVAGERFTKSQLVRVTPEDSGRVFDYIRNQLWIPVDCDKSGKEAVWYINDQEINRFHNQRNQQIEAMQARKINNKLERTATQVIHLSELGLFGELQMCIDEKVEVNTRLA